MPPFVQVSMSMYGHACAVFRRTDDIQDQPLLTTLQHTEATAYVNSRLHAHIPILFYFVNLPKTPMLSNSAAHCDAVAQLCLWQSAHTVEGNNPAPLLKHHFKDFFVQSEAAPPTMWQTPSSLYSQFPITMIVQLVIQTVIDNCTDITS